jgi:hypothetical protein
MNLAGVDSRKVCKCKFKLVVSHWICHVEHKCIKIILIPLQRALQLFNYKMLQLERQKETGNKCKSHHHVI